MPDIVRTKERKRMLDFSEFASLIVVSVDANATAVVSPPTPECVAFEGHRNTPPVTAHFANERARRVKSAWYVIYQNRHVYFRPVPCRRYVDVV